MPEPRLITIGYSHFCEKARWALERAEVTFVEEAHVPMFSWLGTLGAGGNKSAPVLVADGRVLRESTDILRYADEHGRATPLFPEGDREVVELEERFDQVLGPAARRCVYDAVFRLPLPVIGELLGTGAPAWEKSIAKAMPSVLVGAMRRGLRIWPDDVARSKAKLEEVFDDVAARLSDGRRYLVGDRFTAADLTFAALSAPVFFPDAYAKTALPLERSSDEIRETVARYRDTPCGRFALRLYAEERG